MTIDVTIRPADSAARPFGATGVWRDSGQISDLRRWRDHTPQATAIRAHRADGQATLITYAELAGRVERFAGARYQLGVRPGRVIARRVEMAKCGARLLPRQLTASRLRDKVFRAMSKKEGAVRVAAGYAATGGAAHGADLIEQRLLSSARRTPSDAA